MTYSHVQQTSSSQGQRSRSRKNTSMESYY